MKKDVFGLKIDDVSIPEIVGLVESWLKNRGKHYIVTPNPEIVVMAQKDRELKNIINQADLAIPDGAGLKLSGDIVCNSPGIDVMEELIKSSADWGFTIGLLGGKDGIAEEAAKRLRKKYPKLKVSFADSGGKIDNGGNSVEQKELSIPHTDLLFVAFGPPKQEKWIAKNMDKLAVKVAMSVGGSFDVISGTVPRAPGWLRSLGMEWLFRLIIQPWRIKRQLALIKYLVLIWSR